MLGPGHRELSGDEIARRAYELYLQRGGEHGKDVEDWVRAEKEMRDEPIAETTGMRPIQPGRKLPN